MPFPFDFCYYTESCLVRVDENESRIEMGWPMRQIAGRRCFAKRPTQFASSGLLLICNPSLFLFASTFNASHQQPIVSKNTEGMANETNVAQICIWRWMAGRTNCPACNQYQSMQKCPSFFACSYCNIWLQWISQYFCGAEINQKMRWWVCNRLMETKWLC